MKIILQIPDDAISYSVKTECKLCKNKLDRELIDATGKIPKCDFCANPLETIEHNKISGIGNIKLSRDSEGLTSLNATAVNLFLDVEV